MGNILMRDHFGLGIDDASSSREMQVHVKTHFMSLAGLELDYYGADSAEHTFKLDDIVFKVIEDPNDGYRSHLGPIDYSHDVSSIFFEQPIAQVHIEEYSDESPDDESRWDRQLDKGYRLVDVSDGHTWLCFGTGNYDDYYPFFMFRHTPKEA